MKNSKEKDDKIKEFLENSIGINLLDFNKHKELEDHNRHRSTQIQYSDGLIIL